MKGIKEECKCLASLAVFRELYDNQKDVYGVISEFLMEIIESNGKHNFELTEITNLLNKTYYFAIPKAVVYTSLGRLKNLKKEQRSYIVNGKFKTNREDVKTHQKLILTINDIIIEPLFSFIASEKNIELTESEKEKIVHSFYLFLMDDSTGEEYYEYISGFVIKNKQNEEFRNKLKIIREGVILYSGLKYNNNLSEVGSWKTELTIYLDTEILFHFAGYNGIVCKTLFDDFFNYVKEINNKAKKKLICLKFFGAVKEEIEKFFTKAEYIVEGKDKPNPRVTAMSSVIEGCKVPSDVIDKKSDFYMLLKANGINEDESLNYFEKSNHKYNIIDQSTIETISNEFEFDITEYLHFLNFINIRRKEASLNNFYNIGNILLTGNSKTIKVAWHNLIKPEGVVPLATNLYWITNKFWFKLNKGFGDGDFPKSFDVITKAQLLLSSILNESVGEKYEELQIQFKEGKITEEQAKARIVTLRSRVRKPEEIERDDISSILDTLSEDSLEDFIKEQELLKNEAAKQAEENITLKKELDIKNKVIKEQEVVKRNLIETNEKLLNGKKETLTMLENQKQLIDKRVDQRFKNFKLKIGITLVFYYLINYFLIWKFGWNIMEKWTFVINGTLPIIISFLYLLIFEKDWNPKHFLDRKKEQFIQKEYQQQNFNINRLFDLKREVAQLNEEIKNQKCQNPTFEKTGIDALEGLNVDENRQ